MSSLAALIPSHMRTRFILRLVRSCACARACSPPHAVLSVRASDGVWPQQSATGCGLSTVDDECTALLRLSPTDLLSTPTWADHTGVLSLYTVCCGMKQRSRLDLRAHPHPQPMASRKQSRRLLMAV